MKIDRFFWWTNHVQWHTTDYVKEKVKSTIKSRQKPINKMDLQERNELLLLKRKQQLNNSLQTTKLKLMLC